MVERELDDYICFYHAYNYAAALRGPGRDSARRPGPRRRAAASSAPLVRAFPSIAGQDPTRSTGAWPSPRRCRSSAARIRLRRRRPGYRNILAGILDARAGGDRRAVPPAVRALPRRRDRRDRRPPRGATCSRSSCARTWLGSSRTRASPWAPIPGWRGPGAHLRAAGPFRPRGQARTIVHHYGDISAPALRHGSMNAAVDDVLTS